MFTFQGRAYLFAEAEGLTLADIQTETRFCRINHQRANTHVRTPRGVKILALKILC